MDRIMFFGVLLLAYLAANLFIKYDNKRIEAESKLTKRSDYYPSHKCFSKIKQQPK